MSVSKTNTSTLAFGYFEQEGAVYIPLIRLNKTGEITKDNWASFTWRIPGRNVQRNESPPQAAKREYFNKIGFQFEIFKLEQVLAKKSKIKVFESHFQYCYFGRLNIQDESRFIGAKEENSPIVQFFTLEQVNNAVWTGATLDGFTILPAHREVIKTLLTSSTS